jgi:hypothetical protein
VGRRCCGRGQGCSRLDEESSPGGRGEAARALHRSLLESLVKAMSKFVHAFYRDESSATAAVGQLLEAGFTTNDIGALMGQGPDAEALSLPMKHKTGSATGALLGGVLGAVGGGTLALTGGFALLALGPLFALLQGALAGGAAGTLAGTLGGLGFWKDEIDFPQHAFEAGAVLLGVTANDARVDLAREVLRSAGAKASHVSANREAIDNL